MTGTAEIPHGKVDTLVNGKRVTLATLTIDNHELIVAGRLARIASVADEWYLDLHSPERLVEELKKHPSNVDLFTFWQRLPHTSPKHAYRRETESLAALPITSYDHWWNKQLNTKTRNLIRKAQKLGVVVRPATFDDEFIAGMVSIFNETPVRQGKPFWHYGKDAETIKREFSRNLPREELYGAYYNGELIGFIFLAYAGTYAHLGQIISKVAHRDKAPNNALVAKAVEVCHAKNIPYLVYAKWTEGSLGDFKRHNGFERRDLPRYYVPLTLKGALILNLGLHHGLAGAVPEWLRRALVDARRRWYARRVSS